MTTTTTYWVLKHRETGELKRLSGNKTATPHLYRTEGHAKGAASNSCGWSGGTRLSTNWEPKKATLTIE